jgi:hypothetical protein
VAAAAAAAAAATRRADCGAAALSPALCDAAGVGGTRGSTTGAARALPGRYAETHVTQVTSPLLGSSWPKCVFQNPIRESSAPASAPEPPTPPCQPPRRAAASTPPPTPPSLPPSTQAAPRWRPRARCPTTTTRASARAPRSVSSAATLVGQSKQKASLKPTNQPTNQRSNQPLTNYRPLPKIKFQAGSARPSAPRRWSPASARVASTPRR